MVELCGLAVGPYTMVAPITSRPCYYHRSLVWEWKREGRSSKWVKVAAEGTHVPFFLDDNTATVMVDPRGADLDLHRDFHEEFSDSFFTTKEAGSGYGLYLAHELIREQGGRLEATNGPAGGAVFSIWLPAATEAAVLSGDQ